MVLAVVVTELLLEALCLGADDASEGSMRRLLGTCLR